MPPLAPAKRAQAVKAFTPSNPQPAPPAPAKPPPLRPGDTSTTDGRTGERLRRGRMPIEARLDLHGMSQPQAHAALLAFVERGYAEGRRCLLVITGKGGGKLADAQPYGILRRVVPEWLNTPGLRPKLLAVTTAQPQHGGDGALYVLLKRRKTSSS
jgi:DNA-nicking Smr family endonuclease